MIKILFVPRNIKIHSRSFYSLKCQKVRFFPVSHCVNIFFQYHTLSTIKFSKSRLSNARTCLMKCMCMINRMLSQINRKGRSPEKRLSQHERTNNKGQKSPLLEILQTRVHTIVILEKTTPSIAPCIFLKTKKNKKHITLLLSNKTCSYATA